MNYETEIKDRRENGDTPEQIAEAINAERREIAANYTPLKPHQVANWLAGEALEYRIEKWLSENVDNAELAESYPALASAFNGVKAIRFTPNATMRVGPNQDHRALIDLSVQVGAITESDRQRLLSVAYSGRDETAETVQEAFDRHDSLPQRWHRAVTAGAQLVESGDPPTWEALMTAVSEVE